MPRFFRIILALCFVATLEAQSRYHAVDLRFFLGQHTDVISVDEQLRVGGNLQGVVDNDYHPFYYDGAKFYDYGGGNAALAASANLLGGFTYALPSDGGLRAKLFKSGDPVAAPSPFGSTDTRVVAVANDGLFAVGYTLGQTNGVTLYRNGVPTELGSFGSGLTFAAAMNSHGQVVGYSSTAPFTPPHAFLYGAGALRDLAPDLAKGSYATALNESGQVVGYANFNGSDYHAVLWSNGTRLDLGTLGGPQSRAHAISASGVVGGMTYTTPVGGVTAFLYENGVMRNLNPMIDYGQGIETRVTDVMQINDRGLILADSSILLVPNDAGYWSRLGNFSIRANSGTSNEVLTLGFVLQGTSINTLTRAVGPTLTSYGVVNALPDPKLTLFHEMARIDANDSWDAAPNRSALDAATTQVGAFTLAPGTKDAALLSALSPGVHSLQVDPQGQTGVVLAEFYDATPGTESHVANASARVKVGSGENAGILGFSVQGNMFKTVIIRAIGPTLSRYGVGATLDDPVLSLVRDNVTLATNDDWYKAFMSPIIESTSARIGAFPLDESSKDSALIATLPPGNYSAVVSGKNGASGVALIEIYEVP